MAPNPHNGIGPIDEADALHAVIAKLSVLGDFIKCMAGEPLVLDADTTLGLYLIVGDCIESLKRLEA